MQRMTLNLALGAVAAGLAAAVYFSREKEEKGPPLTALTTEAVTRIAVEHPGAPAIRLEKTGDRWALVEPVRVAADPIEVNGLVSLATAETKLTLADANLDLEELGLDPPSYSVTLNDQKIEFGGVEPLNYRRYLRAGGKIVLVDDPPGTALDKDFSDLVSKAPVPEGADIARIALPAFTIARAADGKTWSLSPEREDVSADARQKLIDAWKNTRAMWMAAEPAEGAAKGEPVTITLSDGSEVKLLVVERDPQLVLARPDLKVRYTLSKALETELLALPEPKKEEPAEAIGEAPAPVESPKQ